VLADIAAGAGDDPRCVDRLIADTELAEANRSFQRSVGITDLDYAGRVRSAPMAMPTIVQDSVPWLRQACRVPS
jgi:hypothetical protein